MGAGIDRDMLPMIFENFTQVDGGAARISNGMGIGLRLVKHYVDLHRGRIWVESEKGKGSTFHFAIPLVSEIAAAPEVDYGVMPVV
jgi:signal transduction histidine kinase